MAATAVTATPTAQRPATNDGAQAWMMKNGLKLRAGKLTKLKLLRLTLLLALARLPPTNIPLSPPTLKTHQVHPLFLPPMTKHWQPNAPDPNFPPKNMSVTPYVLWHNRSLPSWNEASSEPKTEPLKW